MERVAHGFVHWLASTGHRIDVWSNVFASESPRVQHRPLDAKGRGIRRKAEGLVTALARIDTGAYDAFLHFERGGRDAPFRAGAGCAAAQASGEAPSRHWTTIVEIDKHACQDAHPLIVNSSMVRDQMVAHYGLEKLQIRLVRNGVDLERFVPGPRSHRPTMVFVGDNARRKGLARALRALLLMPGVALHVVGDVGWGARAQARRLGLSDRVLFHGSVADPERIISQANVMVLPTHYDASANAVLEALACGVPVITTPTNGAAEFLPEGWMTVDRPDEASVWAEALHRAMSEPGLPAICRDVASAHPSGKAFESLLSSVTGGCA